MVIEVSTERSLQGRDHFQTAATIIMSDDFAERAAKIWPPDNRELPPLEI